MATQFPIVDVAGVLIINPEGDKLLLDYNPRWGGFSLPMTKVGEVPATVPNGTGTPEQPVRAAVRAAVEVLGRPLAPAGLVQVDAEIPPWHQSGSDGVWKRYAYHLFALKAVATPHPLPGHVAVWLTPDELRTHEPVSATVRHILTAVPLSAVRAAVGV